jgi:16S rRNA (guanine527-N7)-methyltransferase
MQPEPRTSASSERLQHTLDLEDDLRSGLDALDLPLTDEAVARLLAYLGLLAKWNAVYNLTAVRDPHAMLIQHVLDSLAVVRPLRAALDLDHARIADVGSGAGLPGLLFAIVCPAAQVLSIEPVGKKTAFQKQVAAELALTNVEILTSRAEAVNRPTDLVVSRAFAALADFLSASSGLIGPDTLVAALKGQRAGIEAECTALPPGWQVEITPVTVPSLAAQRHLVLMQPGQPRASA